MKKAYMTPEVSFATISLEDIMTLSGGVENTNGSNLSFNADAYLNGADELG